MKEFKKWLRNTKHANFTWEEDAKNAWRAAMEEVLKWLDYSTEHKEIADKIHDELES